VGLTHRRQTPDQLDRIGRHIAEPGEHRAPGRIWMSDHIEHGITNEVYGLLMPRRLP